MSIWIQIPYLNNDTFAVFSISLTETIRHVDRCIQKKPSRVYLMSKMNLKENTYIM